MKNIIILLSFTFFCSFTINSETKRIPDGNYKTVLDKKFKKVGLLDYDFKIKDDKFIIKIAKKIESLDIIWIDENSFRVIGYTEPLVKTEDIEEILKEYRATFNITKQNEKIYTFYLGKESENDTIYSGKFIKFN